VWKEECHQIILPEVLSFLKFLSFGLSRTAEATTTNSKLVENKNKIIKEVSEINTVKVCFVR
jgi:hypothetical protein